RCLQGRIAGRACRRRERRKRRERRARRQSRRGQTRASKNLLSPYAGAVHHSHLTRTLVQQSCPHDDWMFIIENLLRAAAVNGHALSPHPEEARSAVSKDGHKLHASARALRDAMLRMAPQGEGSTVTV